MFTKYGYTTIGTAAIISFLIIIVGIFVNNNLIKISLFVIAIVLISFTLYFFRDPDRTPPERRDVIVSPADGRVLFVKEMDDEKFIQGKALQVSIFMSPLNVHVNRIPITGKIEYLKHFDGRYIAAFDEKATDLNERTEIGINSKYGKIFFTQVAGMVARRIVNTLSIGDSVEISKRFGMIKFGSRVDVIVPLNWKEKVKKDESVVAGESILFELKN
ncbi:phosphatidylserine decarboxylase family protein [bacterium BMS3Abin03]|jgi:phosphatidylserine decarboxylase|nr:phosphatidylserine decarboxylase family protein [bacterium BMS3Abin03]MCG6959319.1 phosphatidylserine decarboxylase family protein [bacterium BMS3Abin03]